MTGNIQFISRRLSLIVKGIRQKHYCYYCCCCGVVLVVVVEVVVGVVVAAVVVAYCINYYISQNNHSLVSFLLSCTHTHKQLDYLTPTHTAL